MVPLAQDAPNLILEGQTPRLIDEWQLAPNLWNVARHLIDDRQAKGQFIFSGSAQPAADTTRHSGIGRFARVQMRPMSLAETGDSTREISLRDLIEHSPQKIGSKSPLSYTKLSEFAVKGGWPALLDSSQTVARRFNQNYCRDLQDVDLTQLDERRNPERINRLLQVLARNISGELNISKIANEISSDGRSIGDTTVRSDLDALKAVFAYDPLPAWSVDLRSRARLRTREKIHLTDPSLSVAMLGADADSLARQREYFGFVFESMVIRDLRAYLTPVSGRAYHYRDNTDLEIDAIIEYEGSWAAIEAKLGASEIEKAERNLLRLANDKVDTEKIGKPAFLAIITGTEYAYTLRSGVHVIPLATLTW